MACNPEDVLIRHLTDDGSTSGVNNLNVNGSVTPVKFFFTGEDDRVPVIHRLLFKVGDNGAFSADNFAGLGAALTNGIRIVVEDSDENEVLDLFDGGAVDNNADWAEYMFDVRYDSYGAGDNYVVGRMSFDKFVDGGIALSSNHRIVVIIRDDLSAVNKIEVVVQGEYH